MSQSFTNLLYHIIFSTKDRRPLITSAAFALQFATATARFMLPPASQAEMLPHSQAERHEHRKWRGSEGFYTCAEARIL